jgi:pyruvate dehydrogenase E2 component (dihydrolipoamide acetyltransferase)
MAEFLMPILGADMTEGTVVAWRKQPGERVEPGEIIVEVETDKATVEVESFLAGVVEGLLVEEGTKVPVGTPLATVRLDGESAGTTREPAVTRPGVPPPAPTPERGAMPSPPPSQAPRPAAGARVRASPAARKLAEERGIDLAGVTGTGPDGRITREDVEGAAAGAAPSPNAEDERQARMRQAIAAAMSRSAREIPHFHVTRDVDMSRATEWLAAENEKRRVADRLLYAPLLIKATALALREVPELNGLWSQDRVEWLPAINVGVAISLRGGGLVAPALRDTDHRTLDNLMAASRDLVQRARAGRLRSSEITDPTITVTSLGEAGADAVFGLIYPPQVALVGFGRLMEKPWAEGGQVTSRPVITATLTADHRVIDGRRGSVFLEVLDRLLQEPARL